MVKLTTIQNRTMIANTPITANNCHRRDSEEDSGDGGGDGDGDAVAVDDCRLVLVGRAWDVLSILFIFTCYLVIVCDGVLKKNGQNNNNK
jgi:hypothetical protein